MARHRARLVAATALASVAALPPAAHALRGPSGDVPATLAPTVSSTAPATAAIGAAALARAGFDRGQWDHATGVPSRLWGVGVAAPGASANPALAEAAAWRVLSEHLATLAPGSAPGDLELVSNVVRGRVRSLGFRQTYRGLPVDGGELSVAVVRDRVVMLGSSARPHVQVAAMPARADTRARAAHAAHAWLVPQTPPRTARALRTTATGERVVLAVLEPDRGTSYRVVDVVRAAATREPAAWDVFVDAATGQALARRDLVARASATISYRIAARWPGAGLVDTPAARLTHTIGGVPITADAAGAVSWIGDGSDASAGLLGPQVRVDSDDPPETWPATTLDLVDGQAAVWDVGPASDALAFASAPVFAQHAKDVARAAGYPEPAFLDEQQALMVNHGAGGPGATCNALAAPDALYFYPTGGGCENTAAIADVVFHEFAHRLHQRALIPGVGSYRADVAEGIADFFATQLTGDPGMARGLFLTEAPLRHLDPDDGDARWPDDVNADPHLSGLILGGAMWDLRTALIAAEGEAAARARMFELTWAIMGRATDLPSTYAEVLLADDDDGDLGNGTPHQCAIQTAFALHGLTGEDPLAGIGRPRLDELEVTVPVSAPPPDPICAPISVVGGTLTWRLRETPTTGGEVPMTATADGWRASLPAPETTAPTAIEYQVRLELSAGSALTFPANPADPYYQAVVGALTPVWCDDFETGGEGWTLGGEFAVGAPGVGGYDPAAAYQGTRVLGLDLRGDGLYEPGATDAATTPPIDITGAHGLRLQFWRWLTTEDALYDQAVVAMGATELWSNVGSGGELPHLDGEWRFVDLPLAPADGATTIDLTFAHTADTAVQYGGWTIDDVCVMAAEIAATCGDGRISDDETCDDGGAEDGDGCSATCQLEPTDGDDGGGCCQAPRRPGPAPALLLAGVTAWALRRRRRARRAW
jgi:cysteine-rich repeat protein